MKTKIYFLLYFLHCFGEDDIPQGRPILTPLTNTTVDEGSKVHLKCRLTGLGTASLTWSWMCGNDVMKKDTTIRKFSYLSFKAKPEHNQMSCCCRASSLKGTTLIYDQTSSNEKITVFYKPSTIPVLTRIRDTVVSGDTIKLKCSLPRLGNPKITWSWKCGSIKYSNIISNIGNYSTLQFTAKAVHNGMECYCTAYTNDHNYFAVSDLAVVTVYYIPATYPNISSVTKFPVPIGSPIKLRCTLSEMGNPHVNWTWYCGNHIMSEGISNIGRTSELTLIADPKYQQLFCYCKAWSNLFKSDRTSHMKIMMMKDKVCNCASMEDDFISLKKYHATIGVCVSLIVVCLVVITVLILKILGQGFCFNNVKENDASRPSERREVIYMNYDDNYEVIQPKKQRKPKKKKEERFAIYENARLK